MRGSLVARTRTTDIGCADLRKPPELPLLPLVFLLALLPLQNLQSIQMKEWADREIPNIKPSYTVQLKVEVPKNKHQVSILKGIVIARCNAGLNTTFRLRRLVAGVGVESVFPLYSPNIKEFKVLDKKEVRKAKLHYLRDRMNALRK
ncbi:large ribosomal subunit protein bL19cz-like [Magnolia sinica]|uniref:large ribosomal subunit protein bL19cz-like n=1 Tax=Magnolia sinica TaxID=86752 RepID=UPI0026596129|nr:large ribosomal subunit protein bL19cz-like [Magnolia sinica]